MRDIIDWPIFVFATLLALGFSACVWSVYEVAQQRSADVDACIADGRKPYECRALMNSHTVEIPK